MIEKEVLGKSIAQWQESFPLLKPILNYQDTFWCNSELISFGETKDSLAITPEDMEDARKRLKRFTPLISTLFPETTCTQGIIESPLTEINKMKDALSQNFDHILPGNLLLKWDHNLPIGGSVKARGGIYEVLYFAEQLCFKKGLLHMDDDYSIMASSLFRKFFSDYTLSVGSTGNLGLSIGIMGAKLGFKVKVHMSTDAKQWKKNLLKNKGVQVIEHTSDYSHAVAMAKGQSLHNPQEYFIDDENSKNLFLGYSVAAFRLREQLEGLNIKVDKDHPLIVYLPCGVGGAPGGITYGLKSIFGDHVHCFFAEPTHAPSMLMGLMMGLRDKIIVQDFGLDNHTEADGLAVAKPSPLVSKTLKHLISGVYTVSDDTLFQMLALLAENENIFIEPSAASALMGPINLLSSSPGKNYLLRMDLENKLENITHIVWSTGGSLVPENLQQDYIERGLQLLND